MKYSRLISPLICCNGDMFMVFLSISIAMFRAEAANPSWRQFFQIRTYALFTITQYVTSNIDKLPYLRRHLAIGLRVTAGETGNPCACNQTMARM